MDSKNLTAVVPFWLVTGMASIHLVNLSTATRRKTCPPFEDFGSLPIMSRPPLSERPSYRYWPELGPRCVRFVGEPLASVASSDDVLCVAHGRRPVESCS